jgi:hypothetical protein
VVSAIRTRSSVRATDCNGVGSIFVPQIVERITPCATQSAYGDENSEVQQALPARASLILDVELELSSDNQTSLDPARKSSGRPAPHRRMEKDLNWKPSRLAQSQAETAGQRLDYGKDEGDRANASLSREIDLGKKSREHGRSSARRVCRSFALDARWIFGPYREPIDLADASTSNAHQ